VAGAALVAAGAAALLLIFAARDDAPVGAPPAAGPGELQPDLGAHHLPAGEHVPLGGLTDPPTSGAHHPRLITREGKRLSPDEILHALELGDVILFYDVPRPPAPLVAVQREVSGPFDAELAAAGRPKLGHTRVDTLALARPLLRGEVPDHRLSTLARFFRAGTQPTHRALDDARATAEVFHCLLDRAARFGVLTLGDLLAQASQPRWASRSLAARASAGLKRASRRARRFLVAFSPSAGENATKNRRP
jgi:hypothetical protein